jgi:hypothetical protein
MISLNRSTFLLVNNLSLTLIYYYSRTQTRKRGHQFLQVVKNQDFLCISPWKSPLIFPFFFIFFLLLFFGNNT